MVTRGAQEGQKDKALNDIVVKCLYLVDDPRVPGT